MKTILVALLLGAPAALYGQAETRKPEGPPLPPALKSFCAALADAAAFKGEGTIRVTAGGKEQVNISFSFAVRRPNLGRFSIRATGEEGKGWVTVSDGESLWLYDESEKAYDSIPTGKDTEKISESLMPGLAEVVGAYYAAPAAGKPDGTNPWAEASEASEAPDADLKGESCATAKLVMKDKSTATWLVSKKTGLVRKIAIAREALEDEEAYEVTIDFTATTTEAVDEKLFAFAPPEGAKKMERGGEDDFMKSLLAVGADAPEIAGDSPITGKKVKLSDYKGKFVLLNFWFYH